ncbi:DUF4397 domain-containing protein [Clostridium boliviensis]|uniref:DUF4397 domain-containing protein n=1 Tax=Clostridium boliviensis TaxID=318465 RepID=A0ABU4GSU2_9CLOT|nr:DUF4397 domain-containing protein [Clostridium boliviensis]MDW2800710.1 DUF4397 domain-containing protein [Clostridium boliviensis]
MDQYTARPSDEVQVGYVRVMHTVPNAPNVDIYVDDEMIIENLAYGDFTDYLPVQEGTYKVSVYVSGSQDTPVVENMLPVEQNEMLTVAAVGTPDNIGLLSITDANGDMIQGKAMVRFIHLSPDAPAVDITLSDGTVIFPNVAFNQITPYIAADPTNLTLQVRPAGSTDVVLEIPDVPLSEDYFNTIYAVGLLQGNPPLEVLLTTDEV